MHPAASVQARRVVFTGKQQASLETFSLPAPGPDEVRVRVELSLMSTGTENIVFNRLFDPGTHWDQWVKYPFYPGYSAVGTVEEVGANVTGLKPGTRVAVRCGHQSHTNFPPERCHPIPASLPWEEAAWFALAKITFHGVLAADLRLGDRVLVIGAGPIGQMAVRWARAAGAQPIVVVDPVEGRLELARGGGATKTLSLPIAGAHDAILAAGGGKLPRVVIDSTGNAQVFAAALGCAEDYGTVVILGDTGSPANQFLSSDVIRRGLKIVGAHDGHNSERWNNQTITDLFFALASDGRFSAQGLTSHRFKPEDCAEAYATANRERAKTMGIVFQWA
jgi:2-desacetyl-2-hydroxyethyl bacteriochlorophyllide A dehydrogenase